MATKWTTFLLLLSIFLLSTSLALSSSRREDERERERELQEQCRQQCQQQQPHHDRGKQRQCEQQCVEQQREREQESEHERGQGGDSRRKDPEERLEECRQRCTQRRAGQQQQCESKCEERFQEEQREHEGQGGQQGHGRDPEQRFEECRQQCQQQGQKGQGKQQQCEERCRERYEEEEHEQEGGQGRDNPEGRRDPEERLQECRQQCQQSQQEQQQQHQCQQQCEERYQQEKSQGGGGSGEEEEEEEKEDEGRSQNNPYVFRRESFIHRVRTQHGSVRVLRNFLHKSKLLMGIANYRLVIFEANPRTFAVPKYSDAEQVFFVTRGEGTVTLLRRNEERESQSIKRESHNIRKGSIIRVQPGTVVYIINNSNNKKLQIAKLVQPVFSPGQFEDFYIGGGENPESIYRTFSTSILEAALNTQQEKLQRLFGRQGQGAIVQASEEQIRGMSRHSSSSEGGHWPFGGQSSKPFNLLDKRPDYSNQRGQLYIADFEDYQELRDLDVHVTFANITSESMMAPFFQSEATEIAVVVEGQGEFQMVCPHLSSSGQRSAKKGQESEEEQEEEQESEGSQQGQRRYQKVRSRLSKGTVFIIPAGHPTAIIASQEQNLQVVCFEVHAKNSRKVFLTGRNNVVNQMEREAAELSFGVPYKLIQEVFGGSRDEVFVRGPGKSSRERQQQEEEKGSGSSPLEAYLEFSGF